MNPLFTKVKAVLVLLAGAAVLLSAGEIQAVSLGKNPAAGLVQGPDGAFYGTTRNGGTFELGTVFRVARDGYFTTLINFTGVGGSAPGKAPLAPLILGTDGKLYGTTSEGGMTTDLGTVFRMNISGVMEPLHSFLQTGDGHYPKGQLVQAADGNFYLQTYEAVDPNNNFHPGAVARMTPNGTELVLSYLSSFGTDGAFPTTGLTQARDGVFYAVTFAGGVNGLGSIYKMPPSGGTTLIYSFTGGADGSTPQGELVEDPQMARVFYGVTSNGGQYGYGTVFKLDATMSPAVLTTRTSFQSTTEGANPHAGLTLGSDGLLYGTTFAGGRSNSGTIFSISRSGGTLTILHTFTGADGSGSNGRLIEDSLAPGAFYGTTFTGGGNNSGTVFRLIVSIGFFRSLVDLANPNPVAPPVITSYTSANINPNTAFQYQITATGSPFSFGAIGLPTGLSINTFTGAISGTVANAGNYSFTITATNNAGTGTSGFQLIVFPAAPSITSATTASGQVGVNFSYQIVATNSPQSFGATNLPLGLFYNSQTGVISGQPQVPGTFDALLTATNNSGTGSGVLHLTIDGAAPLPTPTPSPTATPVPTPTPTPTPVPVTRLANISTRGPVESGDAVMIAGFIMQGSGSKQIAIRGLGPSLTAFGVASAVQDTTLSLRDQNGNEIEYNDNFGDAPAPEQVALSNNGLTPTNSREAAIVATLAPGNYTVILRATTNGIGLVEVYDLSGSSNPQLMNISTRAKVEQGDNGALIGGFIIQGTDARRLVVRALGPSLTNSGVAGALQDPTVDLYRGSQLILSNDNWTDNSSADRAALQGSGLAPTNTRESALVTTLDPGSYTAVVRGKNNTTGVGLVEVYMLSP